MRETPETLTYGEHLPALYRFAFLMTGSVPNAAEVLRLTVEQAERGDLSDVRDPRRVKRWLFARARHLCGKPLSLPDALDLPGSSASSENPLRPLAALFGAVPEAERSALILFYLYIFDPAGLAEVLDMKLADLPALLSRGRTLLQRQRDARETLLAESQK